jgi:alkylation response protein AidB-like acyl-CoA dehydrogenase
VEFELKYTKAQEEFRDEVRAWLAANAPDGITARPRSFEESRAIYLMRRELGRNLGAKGWLYPSGEKQYGGGGLDLDQIIVLEEGRRGQFAHGRRHGCPWGSPWP